ncbi:hypothetical protein TYRP_022501 [Tyrophagus putrescentiae]|nr:hypothetical protein TYRP_022501 [Tyrophagus putrescentiae]
MIERFDAAETDMDTTPDDLLPTVTERHLELLNVRMKLLKLNGMAMAETPPTALQLGWHWSHQNEHNHHRYHNFNRQQIHHHHHRTTPTDTDLNGSSDNGCFYCRGDHASEQCTVFPLARRSNIIKKRKRCFRCLRKFTEAPLRGSLRQTRPPSREGRLVAHASGEDGEEGGQGAASEPLQNSCRCLCLGAEYLQRHHHEQSPTAAPPITEPPLPSGAEAQLLMMVTYPSPTAPEPLSMNLFTVNPLPQKPITYMPGITVNVVSPAGSALCRVMLNHTSGLGSFVSSPRLLARLKRTPTRLPQLPAFPCTPTWAVATVKESGPSTRPAHRFRHVFYVLDVNRHRFHLPSPAVTRLAEGRGLRLSHAYDADRTANAFDMVMGRSDLPLTGFICAAERMVELRDRAAGIEARRYYTHFGYLLIGGEKENNRSVAFSGGGGGGSGWKFSWWWEWQGGAVVVAAAAVEVVAHRAAPAADEPLPVHRGDASSSAQRWW